MFIYEIFIFIKSKNINVFCFQIITNQTNNDYLFQFFQKKMIIYFNETNNITKKYNLHPYFFNDNNNNIYYRKSCCLRVYLG